MKTTMMKKIKMEINPSRETPLEMFQTKRLDSTGYRLVDRPTRTSPRNNIPQRAAEVVGTFERSRANWRKIYSTS